MWRCVGHKREGHLFQMKFETFVTVSFQIGFNDLMTTVTICA